MSANTKLLRGQHVLANPELKDDDVNEDDLIRHFENHFSTSIDESKKKYNAELAEMSKKIGIDLDDIMEDTTRDDKNTGGYGSGGYGTGGYSSGGYSSGGYGTSYGADDGVPEVPEDYAEIDPTTGKKYDSGYTDEYGSGYGSTGYGSSGSGGYGSSSYGGYGDTTRSYDDVNPPTYGKGPIYRNRPTWGTPGEFSQRTHEQEQQNHIRNVRERMRSEKTHVFSIDNEKMEDRKSNLLESIDELRQALEEDGIDLSRIPEVDQKSSIEEVELVNRILVLKNDKMRYCSFAEEFILFGAGALEELFDGNNVWFGRYSPDLRGWSNTVQVKLRRMRPNTSAIVSNVMSDYNVSHGMRIILELIPSLFMYSKTKKRQSSSTKLYTEDALADSIKRIRDTENNDA